MIRHGEDLFWAGGKILDEISKYHLVLVHLPLGTAIFIYIFRNSLSSKWKNSLLTAVIFPVIITGALYYLRFEYENFSLNLHALVGIICAISGVIIILLRFKHAEAILFTLMIFPLLSGAALEYGTSYFTGPLTFQSSDYEKLGVTDIQQRASFESGVLPVLDKRCVSCHNEKNPQGKINLESLSSIQGSGKFHSFYTAKNLSRSGLYIHITERIPSPKHMPYLKGALSPEEISIMKNWITNGGFNIPGTSRSGEFKARAKKLWAFTDFKKPDIKSIDDFLKPENADVDRSLLLRKLKLTLTGLLPTAEENEAFLRNSGPYEKLVDTYLASQDFGINLSSYWLDLVSYAGERGSSQTEDAELFRNYVIDSFNQDIPYQDFLSGQLIDDGQRLDLVKGRNMLKFLPYDDDEPFYNGEIALSTIFNSTLGIEFKCARCHDHILEPISNERYYSHLTTLNSLMKFKKSIPDHELRSGRGSPLEQSFLDVYETTKNDLSFWKERRKKRGPESELSMDDFANWLTDMNGGVGKFTARVYVNHIWRFVFGKALVEGDGVFGEQTIAPKNLQLLNWLTFEFLEHKSSTKFLLRKLVMSESFRKKFETCIDCSDAVWSKVKRMDAEKVRDNLLKLAGLLNEKMYQGQVSTSLSEIAADKFQEQNLRSVFFLRKRNSEDFISKYLNVPKGTRVNLVRESAPGFNQVYFFVGGEYLTKITRKISEKYDLKQTPEKLVEQTFMDVLSRSPDSSERQMWMGFFEGKDRIAALQTHLRVLISTDEFLYTM